MDKEENVEKLLSVVLDYTFVNIPSETRFWIIRTKKGYFYNEFLINRYIGLGWNIIDINSDLGSQSIDAVKDSIAVNYDEMRPMSAINKCMNFMHSIKQGDVLVIPSAGSRFITFALAGDYFEASDKTYEIEREVISKIDSKEVLIKEVECPYKKRRTISILKTIRHEDLNIKLARALTSYHGISNLDSYGEYILDAIYDNYIFKDKLLVQFNITKKSPIKPREISSLMYGLTEYLCRIIDEEFISTTLNLNSPGKVKLTLEQVAEKVKNGKWYWLILFVLLTGGKAFTFEFPGIVATIKDFATMQDEIDIKKLEKETKEVELIKLLLDSGVDVKELSKYTDIIVDASDSLEVQPEEIILIPVDDDAQLLLPGNDEIDD